jgi:hypothetical protein
MFCFNKEWLSVYNFLDFVYSVIESGKSFILCITTLFKLSDIYYVAFWIGVAYAV